MPQYDLRDYLNKQRQETYRAFIIHAPAMSHKTALARAVQEKLGAYLFDLQVHFVASPELAAGINTFGPRDLENLLLALDVPDDVIAVDNIDFLLNTWSSRRRKEFVGMVDLRLKFGLTDKTFIFFIQTDPVIVRQNLTNTRGQPRIVPLEAFFAL